MGIKFTCPHCSAALNVKSELAGKRGRCPQCQQKIEIPSASTASSDAVAPLAPVASSELNSAAASPAAPESQTAAAPEQHAPAPAQSEPSQPFGPANPVAQAAPATQPTIAGGAAIDPISESPQLQWYVMPPGATSQYGPAMGEEFRNWIKEGRVTAETLVWRQDWPEWRAAGELFPELRAAYPAQPGMAAPMAASGYAIPTAAGAMPTATGAAPMAYPVGPGPNAPSGAAEGGFPVSAPSPVSSASGRRGRYRTRSNTGPMIAIVILVLAMIPLSYFVWKVISDQFSAAPPPQAASPAAPAE